MSKFDEIKKNVENLVAYDLGVSTPPDWRPFIIELIEECEKLRRRILDLEAEQGWEVHE